MAIETCWEPEVTPGDAEPNPAPAEIGLRRTVGQGVLAMTDQSAVSGVRFLTTLIVGRACGPEELGFYSLAFFVMVVFSSALESLVFTPLVVYGSRLRPAARRAYSGGVLGGAALVALVAAISFAVMGLLAMAGGHPGLARVLPVLTVAGPAILAWEFCRWFSLAYRRLDRAIVLDVGVALCQSGAVLGLAATGALSAATAYLVIAAVCTANAGCWLYRTRSSFVFHHGELLPALRRTWSLARWIFAARVMYGAINPAILWILAASGDAEDVGQLSAGMTVIFLYNPVLLGMNNLLFPKAVQALRHGGRAGLRRMVWKNALSWSGGLLLIVAPVLAFGQHVLRLIYGSAFADHQAAIMLLALVPPAAAWMIVSFGGLCAMERTDLTLAATVAALITSVGMATVLVPLWGINGAACSVLASPIAAGVLATVVFQISTATPMAEGEAS